MWTVESDTETLVRDLLTRPRLWLPAREQKIGAASVSWWEGPSGTAVIMAEGGTCDDRTLAEQVVKSQLEIFGLERVAFSVDGSEELRKTGGWPDIMGKAKRLIQSGNVTVLRNGVNNVVGHVIGDHGEYTTEIGRDDPSSRSITTWKCECPWDQYAWQRTRKWKKYEGRPCAHVMALYWKSLATPLDDYDPEQHGDLGTGQKMGPPPEQAPPEGGPTGPGPTPGEAPGAPTPQPTPAPPGQMSMDPSQQPMAPPGAPGTLPPSPMDQLAQMQPPMPGMTPGGMPSPPGSVSIPGAKMQTPFNPIQYPGGTYSKVSAEFQPPEIVRLKNEAWGVAEGKSEEHGSGQYQPVPEGSTGEVLGVDPTTGWVECIFPLEGGELSPYHVKCFLEPSDLEATRQRPPGPFIRRRS